MSIHRKLERIEVIYVFENGDEQKATIQSDYWEQYHGSQEQLSQTVEITEKIQETVNALADWDKLE